jgi:hypothetical protein
MNATEWSLRHHRRLTVTLFFYVLLFVLMEYAHGQVDRLWSMGAQVSSLTVFAIVPFLGAVLLWTTMKRFGGILILGSLPSSILYLLYDRYFEKRIAVAPVVLSPGWSWVFNASYILAIACAVLGALFAVMYLREFHQEESHPSA